MEASHAPLPPPPPPPLPSGGGGGGGAPDMQLPPHLQSMMREMQATLGGRQHPLHNDQLLPMQFGNSHGRGGGRGYQQQNNNRGYGGGQGGRGGGRAGRGGGQRGCGRGGGGGGRGFGGRGGGRGNGFGGRGGGRGGHYNHQRHEHQQQQQYGQVKRKRDFDGNGAARFFLPSCLEDPWLPLLQPVSAKSLMAGSAEVPAGQRTHASSTYGTTQLPHLPAGSLQQHQHHQHHHLGQQHAPRPGRVLFQPSFLDDPWAAFVR